MDWCPPLKRRARQRGDIEQHLGGFGRRCRPGMQEGANGRWFEEGAATAMMRQQRGCGRGISRAGNHQRRSGHHGQHKPARGDQSAPGWPGWSAAVGGAGMKGMRSNMRDLRQFSVAR